MLHLCDVRMTERPSLMMLRMQSHRKRRALGSIPVVGSSCNKCNLFKTASIILHLSTSFKNRGCHSLPAYDTKSTFNRSFNDVCVKRFGDGWQIQGKSWINEWRKVIINIKQLSHPNPIELLWIFDVWVRSLQHHQKNTKRGSFLFEEWTRLIFHWLCHPYAHVNTQK